MDDDDMLYCEENVALLAHLLWADAEFEEEDEDQDDDSDDDEDDEDC